MATDAGEQAELVIVGCGPKAIAIAAKAYVLKELGWTVPSIVVVDKFGPAANWDGTNGYTDGACILGTTPFEDVGFPYESSIDKSADEAMLRFSYMAYLVDSGSYAEWVDRLLTPPTHGMLAEYLKWVVKKIDLPVIVGTVIGIDRAEDRWSVKIESPSGSQTVWGRGLVITGPGESFQFPRTGISPVEEARIYNGQDFWHHATSFQGVKDAHIAVIGGGETAAGVATSLLGTVDSSTTVEIVARHPILFTRNEHWMEVMYFSKVMNWAELSRSQKLEVIHHVDRGTFSVAAKQLLDSVYNVTRRLGNVQGITSAAGQLQLVMTNQGVEQQVPYDYIVEATGFNPLSFLDLFANRSFLPASERLPDGIESDLTLPGISPKLHVPGLAAIAQGPGFPNLSCLGLLSERVLAPYIHKE